MGRARVFISTDLRLSSAEKDDAQSLIHALLYQDKMDIVGISGTASKWGHQNGRVEDIDKIIDIYGQDYSKLAAKSSGFKTVSELKAASHQGATATAPSAGYSSSTASSKAIIAEAKKAAAAGEKLNVLTWGGETDLAQALHDDPTIAAHIRFFNIDKQDPNAHSYIARNFKGKLDMWVDNQTTFRGMHNGMDGRSLIKGWHQEHAKGHGSLGDYFAQLSGDIFNESGVKMGDSPTVLRFISGNQNDPTQESWGGEFRKVSEGYYTDRTDSSLNWSGTNGAMTIYEDRAAWLKSFQERLDWLKGTGSDSPAPSPAPAPSPGTNKPPTTPAPSPNTPAPSGNDVVTVKVSGDHYKGSPNFVVSVDGKTVDSSNIVTAVHQKGQWQTFTFKGDFGADPKTVSIAFNNDAWGGSASTDRNLYVDEVSLNGKVNGTDALYKKNESKSWDFGSTPAPGNAPKPDTTSSEDVITVRVSGDHFQGAPNFAFLVDGKVVDASNAVSAVRSKGQWQEFTFRGDFDDAGLDQHKVGIKFDNDLWHGTKTTDRNIYVDKVVFNGVVNDTDAFLDKNATKVWDFNI
jgi:Protein of unknown function (DUF1593)/Ca-dependent carbohydrate-binding module xylan-binding